MKLADDGPEPLFALLLAQQPMLPDFYAEASSAARARDDVKTEFWRNKAKQFKQLDPAKEKALAQLVLSEKKQDEKNRQAEQRLDQQRRQEKAWSDQEALRNAERYQAERAVGNGRRYFSCTFRCRSGVFDASDKMTLTIKADEDWAARDALKPKSTETCRRYRQGFYSSDESCEEIR